MKSLKYSQNPIDFIQNQNWIKIQLSKNKTLTPNKKWIDNPIWNKKTLQKPFEKNFVNFQIEFEKEKLKFSKNHNAVGFCKISQISWVL